MTIIIPLKDSHTGIRETVASLNSTGREVCNPKVRLWRKSNKLHRYAFHDFIAQGSRHWAATSGPQLVWIFKQWVTRFNRKEFLFTNIMTSLSRMMIICTYLLPTDMGTSAAPLWWTPPLGWLSLLASPWPPSSSGRPNRHGASYKAMLLIFWTSWLFLGSNNFFFNVIGLWSTF